MEVLDLRGYSTLCGDYSVHILEKLEKLRPGAKLKVLVDADGIQLLREAVENIVSAGLAEVESEGEEDGSHYVVFVKK